MSKRIFIASLMGFFAGIFCLLGGIMVLDNDYSVWQVVYVLLHRTIMGFVIGISSLKVKWYVNGGLIGLIIGILFVLYEQITKEFFGYQDWVIFALIPTGIFYGLFIEYMTTKVFKAPNPSVKL